VAECAIRQHSGHRRQTPLDAGPSLRRRPQSQTRRKLFSLLNRITLNLLRQKTSLKRGIMGKRLKAGWDQAYLLKLLGISYALALRQNRK
jgi:hypothetical protein